MRANELFEETTQDSTGQMKNRVAIHFTYDNLLSC